MVTLLAWETESLFTDRDGRRGSDEFLFHYTSVERAAAIALTGSIVLSPLNVLNDPRESQEGGTIRVAYGLGPRPLDDADLVGQHDRIVRDLRASIRVACFTRDSRGRPGFAEDADARGFARPRMWAQYADASRGCCIAFDRGRLLEAARQEIPTLQCGDVHYSSGFDPNYHAAHTADFNDPRSFVAGSDPRAQHARVVQSLLYKNGDWRDEREFRIIADEWPQDRLCGVDVSECVVGIAFGPALPPHHLLIVEALKRQFELDDLNVALMALHDAGILAAFPIVGPDGRAYGWSDDELRHGEVFDPVP